MMAEVWKLDLPQNEKFVLLAFADHADDEGITFPSIGRIAWKTGYARRQVQVISASLRAGGLLEVMAGNRGGRSRSTLYRIRPEKGVKNAPFRPLKTAQSEAQKGAVGMQKRAHPSAHESSVTIKNHQSASAPEKTPKPTLPTYVDLDIVTAGNQAKAAVA